MPFRTRDFILFLLTIAFMVIGITTTIKNDLGKNNNQAMVIEFNNNLGDDFNYEAVLPESPADERPSRLAVLREKIADVLNNDDDSQITNEVEEAATITSTQKSPSGEQSTNSVSLCSNYKITQLDWNPNDLQFEIVEGARILYRETTAGSSTEESLTEPRSVVLQLPLRTSPRSIKSCLKTDIIGIALDGSLIRNNEQAIYKIFDSQTLIGYALDGFPIYGLNNSQNLDECGGAIISGEYRYYLSADNSNVIKCFSEEPVDL